jgi:hypothetical protein
MKRAGIVEGIASLDFEGDSGILHVNMFEDAHMCLEKTREYYGFIDKITGGQKYFALINSARYYTVDEDALEYAALPQTFKNRVAAAHYTNHIANRLLATFFRNYFKPEIPVKVFKTEAEARKWLLLQKPQLEKSNHQ